jgi:ornithine cyclodeaminase/alanine dehydrogenase-like protein (mu-crystallin family)
MPTLLLSKTEVERLLNPEALLLLLKQAFIHHSLQAGSPVQRCRSVLPHSQNSTVILFPGLSPDLPVYSVKVHAKHPDYPPAIKGVLHLHDLQTGELLAVMDSTHLTAVRTGLTAAFATHLLAPTTADAVAVIGAGTQGALQLESLIQLRSIRRVFIYDLDPRQAQALAHRINQKTDIPITICSTLDEAVANASIILTATWSREPFLFSSMIPSGTHITSLGADEPGKIELDATLIQDAVFICDDRNLTMQMGAVGNAGLDPSVIDAELGEVLAGRHPGRIRESDITVFSPVGLAFQDLAAAWLVYQEALKQGVGTTFSFY